MSEPFTGRWPTYFEEQRFPAPADPGGRVLVVSAHPDDEVLAVGAWLAAHRDRQLTFVTATDGEASHPGSPTLSPDELRDRRPRELLDALRRLGIDDPVVHRLQLPDSGLADRHDDLARALRPLVGSASLVLAPFEHDGHPDHEAVGAVTAELCRHQVTLWQFPIWTWAWTAPADQRWQHVPHALASSSADRRRKRDAIDAFDTQIRPLSDDPADRPVVGHVLLEHARSAPEVVLL